MKSPAAHSTHRSPSRGITVHDRWNMHYWLLSPGCRSAIEQVASSSSGLYTLSISKVEGLPMPICSIAEQKEIILRITEAFQRIDELFSEASRAAKLLDRLEEATLGRAFR